MSKFKLSSGGSLEHLSESGLKSLIRDLQSRIWESEATRDRLQAEVTRLSGKTNFCPLCEGYAKERDKLKRELEEAHVDCIRLQQEINCLRMEPCQLPKCDAQAKDIERLRIALDTYGSHQWNCILSRWHAGEPTPDGGYRNMFDDKWYQVRPVDETPKCGCGFTEALGAEGGKDAH